MSRTDDTIREEALVRARAHSPFLRDAIAVRPDVAELFAGQGSEAAARFALTSSQDLPIDRMLRRQRHALALAVALGDLAGELPLERVTGLLSDFADEAIDSAVAAAIGERAPD